MRTTNFMDKQMMMGLSRSRSDDDFSVDFSRNSSSLNNNTNLMDQFDSARASHERVGASDHSALISAIDRKVKEHVDNVLYAVEGISARLSQLETRTRHLESCVDDLKESVEYNRGRVDGKLRELENILREVQGGVLDLRDKQEIAEAQFQLAKLQALKKKDKGTENQNNSMQMSMAPETFSFSHQQTQTPLPDPVTRPQVSVPQNVPPSQPYQNPQPVPAATAVQIPDQIPRNQIYSSQQPESYYPPPPLAPETVHQQYHSTQYAQPQPSAQHQPLGPAPISWLQHPSQLHQAYRPLTNHPEENYLTPPQTYPPSVHKLSQPHMASQTQTQIQQPYVGSAQQMHDQPSGGPFSEYPSPYSQPPGYPNFGNTYPYSGSPTSYRSPTMKSTQPTQSASASAGGNNHSRLPTAKLLPQAIPTAQLLPQTLPTASGVDGGTGNRVPVDDVVDKVVAMGFRRDLVRATVRKITENGQSVDLNAVLDKLNE